jgi:transcriptional regulator with XRE-family HTH domain
MPTFSDWVNAKTYPRIDKIELMANYFGISKADLVEEHGSLTKKDERDIEKILDSTREQLLTQQGLMFDGDPATPEAIESILSAMQIGMEMAKKKNKEKYTPKKYKKD